MSNPIQRTAALRLAVELGDPEESPEITTARAQVFADFIAQPAETGPSEPEGPMTVTSLRPRHRDDDYDSTRKVPFDVAAPEIGPTRYIRAGDPEFASDAYDRGWNEALDCILSEGDGFSDSSLIDVGTIRVFIEGIRK